MSDFQNAVTPLQNPTRTAAAASTATNAATGEDDTLKFARAIAHAADERKGADIRVLRVEEVSFIADYFIIVTGFSSAQVRAIARSMTDVAAADFDRHPIRTEGQGESSWILQDYGEVIVHIFLPEARDYYGLEAFWGHAEEVSLAAQS
ncbi:MAG: ribosome silencing factor [Cyanobacteria bacterium P01_C01_bin.120]